MASWAIRKSKRPGSHKLILSRSGEPELYNLAADPQETKNLAGDDAAAVRRLTERLDAWWRPGE